MRILFPGFGIVQAENVFRKSPRCLKHGLFIGTGFLLSLQIMAAVILSEDSRRALYVVSETERTAKWVCPLPVLTHAALSQGERVDRDGAFFSRRGPGEGSIAGRGGIRQAHA